jgi:hypothetical protein
MNLKGKVVRLCAGLSRLVQDRLRLWAFVDTVLNPQFP